jgi:hypothetical protein
LGAIMQARLREPVKKGQTKMALSFFADLPA